jgi:O-acetyl-ADP-ribose deacetylase (regulator of RNase III)
LASGLPALAHGCNLKGTMGAGIALAFRRRWPEMYDAYRQQCRAGWSLGEVFTWGKDPVIFNLATQPTPGPTASLDAIHQSTTVMLNLAEDLGLAQVGLPRLGAGLGGLQWSDVYSVLVEVSVGRTVGLVIYELQ